ncbi:hypothetical protein PHMEG_0007421 [Phytophthora megakarya]|uniref:DDE-1 domain-containing protein n=1 Tax=Phytophthora megakarya TaxID=4795 RepID=A0A225WLZ8_9STRA|nr:hypothetical protein PHMEG_0007421 [Phytophthora megakarya]
MKPFVVFAGVLGARVADELTSPPFDCSLVEHTVQVKHGAIRMEWISKIWRPSVTGYCMLLLDSLKVHKMTSIREAREEECSTQVQFILPGITGVSQPMDVSVMQISTSATTPSIDLLPMLQNDVSSCRTWWRKRGIR